MAETRTYGGYTYEQQPDGSWRRMGSAQPQMPADPRFPYEGAQAQAQAANTGAQAQVNQATIPAQINQAQAQATTATRTAQTAGLPEGFMWGPDGQTAVPIPGYSRQGLSPEIRAQAIQAYGDAASLEHAADEIERLYRAGPGSTQGIAGIRDYLPTDANRLFDDAGQQARGYVKRSLGFTGGEGNTVAESSALYDPYLPNSWDRDAQIERKITELRRLAEQARQKSTMTLGGIPDPNGNITPIPGAQQDDHPNVWTSLRIGSDQALGAAPGGSTTGTDPVPPELKAEFDALLGRMLVEGGGRLDPDAYAAAATAIANKYNYDPADYAMWARDINTYLDQGGKTLPSGVQQQERELSGIEQFRNNLVNNPVGGAAAGFADMGGFGGVSALAPEQMAALGEAQPIPMAVGQVGGAIAGTSALGRLGTATLGRVAPGLLGGAGKARFARNLATDAVYGGIYGGVTEGDPFSGAALATLGSVGGQGVGKGLGRAVSGVTSSPTISRLYEQGVRPTLGQIARGRAADNGGRSLVAGMEDTVANSSFLGNFVNNARNRALEDANLAAFNIPAAGNGRVTGIREQGLSQLDTIKDAAYSNALDGVSVPADDPAFREAFDAAGNAGQAADAARGRGDFSFVVNNKLGPALGNGPTISGQQLQDGLRLLQGQSRVYNKAATGMAPDPAAAHVADSFDLVGDSLTDLAGNYYPDAMPQLRDANGIYRSLRVLDDAAERGRSEGGLFTGAQLGDAVGANNRQFGSRGFMGRQNSPFHQLQQDMVAALPNKVPPTGVNAAPMLALLGAGVGGAGYATDNDALKYAALLSLASLPYTRAGQNITAGALLNRPASLRAIGSTVRKRAGLLGSATVPFALEAGS